MYGDLGVLIGSGIVGFILVYLFAKLGEKNSSSDEDTSIGDNHVLLRLLILAVLLGVFIVIGATTNDISSESCSILEANSTVTNNVTVYEYEEVCFTNVENFGTIFYSVITWFVYFVSLYLFGYLLYKIYVALREGVFKKLGGGK